MSNSSSLMLVLGHPAGLEWVLRNEQMAWTEHFASDAMQIKVGFELFIYTTKRCFSDGAGGRVIGRADVVSAPDRLDEPIVLAGKTFTTCCRFRLLELAPKGAGVEFAPLAPDMKTFRYALHDRAWPAYLRRPHLILHEIDAELLRDRLGLVTTGLRSARQSYLEGIPAQPA